MPGQVSIQSHSIGIEWQFVDLFVVDAVSVIRPYVTIVMFFKAITSLYLKVLKLFQ